MAGRPSRTCAHHLPDRAPPSDPQRLSRDLQGRISKSPAGRSDAAPPFGSLASRSKPLNRRPVPVSATGLGSASMAVPIEPAPVTMRLLPASSDYAGKRPLDLKSFPFDGTRRL